MADLFISYSRHDSEMVRRLHGLLEQRGKDAWVDWEDIPATADWFERIKDGIREAGSFVFVLSPDSLRSEVCAREVEFAAERGKRMVPLLARAVDGLALPESIARHNWIDLTGEDWSAEIDRLVAALDTDLEYVGAHTRWLTDAERWADAGRPNSLLPRGSALAGAERWLADAQQAGRQPAPSPLHLEYILAARNAKGRRQRLVTGAVSVALLVSVGLGIVALTQRNSARAERRTAQSRELAANALLNLPTDPELGLLLARQAALVEPTGQAVDALRQSLLESRVRLTFHGSRSGITTLELRPDGKVLATGEQDGTIRLWDPGTGRQLHVLTGHKVAVDKLVFAPDGTTLVSSANDGTIRFWDTNTGAALGLVHDDRDAKGRIPDFAVSRDGRIVAAAGFLTTPILWDAHTYKRLAVLPRAGSATIGDAIAISPDSKTVALAEQNGDTVLYDIASGRPKVRLTTSPNVDVEDVEYSPSGSLIATADSDDLVRIWSSAGKYLGRLAGHRSAVLQVRFSHDGKTLASASSDGTARLWDLSDGSLTAVLSGHRGDVNDVAFSPDDTTVATAGDDDTARLWNASGTNIAVLRGHTDRVTAVRFTPDGGRVLTSSADRTARAWAASADSFSASGRNGQLLIDAETASPQSRFMLAGPAADRTEHPAHELHLISLADGHEVGAFRLPGTLELGRALSDDGRFAVAGPSLSEQPGPDVLLDAHTGRVLRTLPADTRDVVGFSADGRLMAVVADTTIEILSTATGKPVRELRGHVKTLADGTPNAVYAAVFSPDGTQLLSDGADGARLWDVRSGRELRLLKTPAIPAAGQFGGGTVSFDPDGTEAVTTAGWTTTALVWDLRTGQQLEELAGHASVLFDARFSPDGSFIATVSDDRSARVWDASSGKSVTIIRPDPGGRARTNFDKGLAIAFAGHGNELDVVGDRIHSYACTICGTLPQLLALAARRVTRALTASEQRKYLHR